MHKVAGAAARAGHTLEEVRKYASEVGDGIATVGVSLSNCNIPGKELSTRLQAEDGNMELGLGELCTSSKFECKVEFRYTWRRRLRDSCHSPS